MLVVGDTWEEIKQRTAALEVVSWGAWLPSSPGGLTCCRHGAVCGADGAWGSNIFKVKFRGRGHGAGWSGIHLAF